MPRCRSPGQPLRVHVPIVVAQPDRPGFFGAAMLPMSELEYTGVTVLLDQLGPQFHVRADKPLRETRAH